MKVIPVSALSDNYIWLIEGMNKQQVICVDPGDASPVLEVLKEKNLTLEAILLTHHHFDHIGGTAGLLKAYPHLSVYGPKDMRIPYVTHTLQGGDILALDSYQFTILSTPGHTSTHICFYEPQQKWLFCGDTLFSAGCGRVFDGSIEALHDSLQMLKTLPDDTQAYCAHEYTQQNLRFAATVEPNNPAIYHHLQKLLNQVPPCSLPSTITLEKQINPFFRTQVAAVKEYAKLKGCQEQDSLSVFREIRAEKDKF